MSAGEGYPSHAAVPSSLEAHPGTATLSVRTGNGNLLRNAGVSAPCGLEGVRVSAARIVGVDPTLGESPHPVLSVEVCGGEAVAAEGTTRKCMDVVLIVDTSGSMCGAIAEVRETCIQVFNELRNDDNIAVVTFESCAKTLLSLTRKASVSNFTGVCERIHASGATNIEEGLKRGIDQLRVGGLSMFSAGRAENLALAIMLSDGSPTRGFEGTSELLDVAKRVCRQTGRAVSFHSLGFTAHHDINLMRQLPSASNGPNGSYYYVGTTADVSASIGDCLGSASAASCRNVSIAVELLQNEDSSTASDKYGWYRPASEDCKMESSLLGLRPGSMDVMALQPSEKQIGILVLPPQSPAALVRLNWESDAGPHSLEARIEWCTDFFETELAFKEDMHFQNIEELTVSAHVLRLQVAAALSALAITADVVDRYYPLHGTVLQCLAELQRLAQDDSQLAEAEVLFLEGMLQALERDLGEALSSRQATSERRGVLLSFAAEHFTMRSASSLTRVRTAYATRAQIQTRLRFLQSSAGDANSAKESCVLEDEGCSVEELSCRKSLESNVCYMMLSNWRDCVLGVGLFVHPRTCRERRNDVPPEVDLVVDYVSAEAYNLGVRTVVHHAGSEEPVEDSDDESAPARDRPDVLQSSTRRRINAWLPLYINAANWAVAKTFAPSAFSLIATQLNAVFQPEDALKVCARLMCCVVVGFVRTPDEKQRAGASERAVQMYCDVHRLFLQMANDYPQIWHKALAHVRSFMDDPQVRTRKGTSDLGLLITYLSILDGVSWAGLCGVFVPEMVRRAFGRIRVPFDPDSCETEQEIIDRFDNLEPEHGRVIAFFKVFNSLVARPTKPWQEPTVAESDGDDPLKISAVCDMYDRRWGQLPHERRDLVIAEIKRIRGTRSVVEVLRELLPFPVSREVVCELLLWAAKHGSNTKAISDGLLLSKAPTHLVTEWRRRREMRQKMELELRQISREDITAAECITRFLSIARRFEQCGKTVQASGGPTWKYSSKEEACAAAALARERAANRKGKGKGKGNRTAAGSDSESASEEEGTCRTDGGCPVGIAKRGDFAVDVVITSSFEGYDDTKIHTLSGVCYENDQGLPATGRDLRTWIAEKTSLDARKMRLIVKGARRVETDSKEDEPSPAGGESADDALVAFAMSNSAVLSTWRLEAPGVVVEVQKKQRGKSKPGNGWHASRKFGITYPLQLASAIVKQTVFDNAEQYFTVVRDNRCFDTIVKLCDILDENAVVLCGAGTSILHLEAQACGWTTSPGAGDGVVHLKKGARSLLLMAEIDAADRQPITLFYEEAEPELPIPAPEQSNDNKGGKGGKGVKVGNGGKGSTGGKGGSSTNVSQTAAAQQSPDKTETMATVTVPPEAQSYGLAFVLNGGMLREVSSFSKVIYSMRKPKHSGAPLSVFHLVTDVRQVLVETEDQLNDLAAQISQDGVVLNTVDLDGQPCVPKDSMLMAGESDAQSAKPELPPATKLPAVACFRLRLPGLGFVVRLRERFGCTISEVCYGPLRSLMDARCCY